ncbi:MAG: hypothetical protein ACD_45C00740G0003 [uncultured bacterium]|nr:MAG: hypothetical protein ACD_45C00740G0003 [uncultured bacterium]
MELVIEHDQNHQRFYATSSGQLCELKYKKIDQKTLDYFKTFVPESLRNQGIASQLTRFSLEFAKQNNYHIIPSCPYVKLYIDKHPEYKHLIK